MNNLCLMQIEIADRQKAEEINLAVEHFFNIARLQISIYDLQTGIYFQYNYKTLK